MALNDKDMALGGNKGIDLYPGVANPTASSTHSDPLASNFVSNATGAGEGPGFSGGREARRNFSKTAGVVEGRPGIIESANIDPLNENSNKDDGWANASGTGADAGGWSSTASDAVDTTSSYAASAATVAAGTTKMAYGHVVGDEATKQAGKEQVWGKQ
ncbi:uncharacterized protein LAESUDRAFT_741047 [Laetiporus sulphureus 93-53]|uniref:Uncharacterized protein n=1 Tax=Laetiporus sulphureus 93-53 TaxID=1314785 RepID=A0A165HE44_9APHY|nr:uncharacterized protein LAESUDRAFT_741047 [Laetiporus sulphureus 93-53]KZT11614.1 hypothetical protein LAESUDRAFT_741047 [Laetiporus sulphureus 93-53]